MRCAPHNRLFTAMSLISAMVSAATRGVRLFTRDFSRQNRRKPRRCQPNNVSGLTSSSAWCQTSSRLASTTNQNRSVLVSFGRLTWRLKIMSCWRSSAFSANNCALLRVTSKATPAASAYGAGCVACLKRTSCHDHHGCIERIKTNANCLSGIKGLIVGLSGSTTVSIQRVIRARG